LALARFSRILWRKNHFIGNAKFNENGFFLASSRSVHNSSFFCEWNGIYSKFSTNKSGNSKNSEIEHSEHARAPQHKRTEGRAPVWGS
jgi:hypothetical protein